MAPQKIKAVRSLPQLDIHSPLCQHTPGGQPRCRQRPVLCFHWWQPLKPGILETDPPVELHYTAVLHLQPPPAQSGRSSNSEQLRFDMSFEDTAETQVVLRWHTQAGMSARCLKRLPGLSRPTSQCSDYMRLGNSCLSNQPASMTCSFPAREHFYLAMSYFPLLVKNSKKQLCVITSRAELVLRSNTVITSSPAKRAVLTRNSILHLCISAVSETKTADRIGVCWAFGHHFSCDNPWCCSLYFSFSVSSLLTNLFFSWQVCYASNQIEMTYSTSCFPLKR